MSDEKPFSPGLAGVIGAETAIGFVDGANGKLLYRGYPIEEVVTKGTYASVLDLLLTGEWHPNAALEPVNSRARHVLMLGTGAIAPGDLPDLPGAQVAEALGRLATRAGFDLDAFRQRLVEQDGG